MKKIILIVFSLYLANISFAQRAVGSHEDLEKFYKTTTCFVYDDDIFSPYNGQMENAVKIFWAITPYKFIKSSDFEKMKGDSRYSFVIRTVIYSSDNTQLQYNTISLVLGEAGKSFNDLPEIGSLPLTFIDQDDNQYLNKLGAFLIFLQKHINITYNNKSINQLNILQYYKKNKSQIAQKTIYLTADDLDATVDSPEKIAKYFTGKVKIVEIDEVQQIIESKDTNAIIAHIVAPSADNNIQNAKIFKLLVGAADGNLYYFDDSNSKNSSAKFSKDDFRNLK